MQPGLREKVLEVAHSVIRRSLQPTHNMVPWQKYLTAKPLSHLLAKVSNLIRIEKEFINAAHHNSHSSVHHVQG